MDRDDEGRADGAMPDLTTELQRRLRELEAAETPERLLERARILQGLLRRQRVGNP